ncbi:MAG: electron transfer flavoprotein subunit alpha/FixB family protein [Candidatus Aminicenantales bacterium]
MFLIYIETREGKVKKSSLEVLFEAKRRAGELNMEVAAALVGPNMEHLATEIFPYGASRVFLLESPRLGEYSSQGYAAALFDLVNEVHPEAVLFAATSMGKDLAPRLAAKLGTSLASDCTSVSVKDGRLEFTRPIYAGKAFMTFTLKSKPQLATLRPNVFPLGELKSHSGEVVRREMNISEDQVKGRVIEVLREKGEDLDVTEAEIIVSGGRGMKGPENFALLKDLAAVLPRSAVGASRSAVDSGWIDHQNQVGQTGKTVSPNLYMAFGISGAIQHLAGMSSSKCIVAINKDPEAPIFKVADYGIVADLFQVIPPLKDELKILLSG